MYARTTILEIDTARISVDAALKAYVDGALPDVKAQPGYEGILMMSTPEGKGLVITFWTTEEAAEAASPTGFYADVIEQFVTLFKSPPGRERYHVDYSEVPAPVLI